MELEFRLPRIDDEAKAIEYIKEFFDCDSVVNGSGGLDHHYENYSYWLDRTLLSHKGEESNPKYVPASTYFVFDENDLIVGMVNIRHKLNSYLIDSGSGHIGYSVRPTERRKGYATEILRKALNILKHRYHVKEALLGCYEGNIGSKKTILNNGGELLRVIEEGKEKTLAYRIKL